MTLASFSSEVSAHDALIAGHTPLLSRGITLASGENTVRGAVLGKYATAGTIGAAASAGNTGNGTIGTLSVGGAAREGRYRAICIEPAANAGVFAVEDPDGVIIGRATVAVAFAGAVNFTIADGATDFVAGDAFDIDVSAVTYKYKLAVAAAGDGSQVPDAVLSEDCDASAADKATVAYVRGDFAENKLTLGAGMTLAGIRERLRAKGITLIATQGA